MRTRLAIALGLLVLLPLGLLAWLGVWAVRGEQMRLEAAFGDLQTERLVRIEQNLLNLVADWEHRLQTLANGLRIEAPAIRSLVHSQPAVSQVLLLDAKGDRLHPPPDGPLTDSEREFLQRAGPVLANRGQFVKPTSGPAESAAGTRQGWVRWYHQAGVQFLFWVRRSDGLVAGFELNRYWLMSELIGGLPVGKPGQAQASDRRLALLDSLGRVIHQWGGFQPKPGAESAARRQLGDPLSAWSLVLYAPPVVSVVAGLAGTWIVLLAGLFVVAAALSGVAVFLYRESGREAREAAQRVSFVNHVSHELKTPLTNIRMYAELLSEHLDSSDPKQVRFLGVVVSESQRLSRLIENVLTFGRHQNHKLKLRKTETVVDEVIRGVLDSHGPLLMACGVRLDFSPGAPNRVCLDADALGQILGNLLANVEKYAHAGGRVTIDSDQAGDKTTIRVADSGPGIPTAEAERIFEPFIRLGSGLVEGSSGTGIGLTISRQLARLHGGDLCLEPSMEGAVFRLELATESGGG